MLHQNASEINEAIRDLGESKSKNQNRALYRSSPLLDQDQASRNAQLAAIYRDAGMNEAAVREVLLLHENTQAIRREDACDLGRECRIRPGTTNKEVPGFA